MPDTKARPIFPLLLAIALTGSRFLLGRLIPDAASRGIAALVLDAIWLIPCVIRLRKNPKQMMLQRTPRLLLSAGLMLLFFGILQVLRLFFQTAEPLKSSLSFREILILLDLVLLSPLLEEWVFRGEGYLTFRKNVPVWGASLFSALLFAAGHLDQGTGPAALVFGILACILLESSASLLFPAALHILVNAFSLLPPLPGWGCAALLLAGLLLTGTSFLRRK